jgi:hypothetical protein
LFWRLDAVVPADMYEDFDDCIGRAGWGDLPTGEAWKLSQAGHSIFDISRSVVIRDLDHLKAWSDFLTFAETLGFRRNTDLWGYIENRVEEEEYEGNGGSGEDDTVKGVNYRGAAIGTPSVSKGKGRKAKRVDTTRSHPRGRTEISRERSAALSNPGPSTRSSSDKRLRSSRGTSLPSILQANTLLRGTSGARIAEEHQVASSTLSSALTASKEATHVSRDTQEPISSPSTVSPFPIPLVAV